MFSVSASRGRHFFCTGYATPFFHHEYIEFCIPPIIFLYFPVAQYPLIHHSATLLPPHICIVVLSLIAGIVLSGVPTSFAFLFSCHVPARCIYIQLKPFFFLQKKQQCQVKWSSLLLLGGAVFPLSGPSLLGFCVWPSFLDLGLDLAGFGLGLPSPVYHLQTTKKAIPTATTLMSIALKSYK